MQPLSTDLIGQACRIFLAAAYPGGEKAVPVNKQFWLSLRPGLAMLDLVGEPAVKECCQVVPAKSGGVRALLFRLGCSGYPNLKLKVQLIEDHPDDSWLFSVDTHDGFSATSFLPPAGHPEAAAWTAMQAANVALKQRIEAAWQEAGLLTFNGLLRRGLGTVLPSLS
jgi:hypothetical protein